MVARAPPFLSHSGTGPGLAALVQEGFPKLPLLSPAELTSRRRLVPAVDRKLSGLAGIFPHWKRSVT